MRRPAARHASTPSRTSAALPKSVQSASQRSPGTARDRARARRAASAFSTRVHLVGVAAPRASSSGSSGARGSTASVLAVHRGGGGAVVARCRSGSCCRRRSRRRRASPPGSAASDSAGASARRSRTRRRRRSRRRARPSSCAAPRARSAEARPRAAPRASAPTKSRASASGFPVATPRRRFIASWRDADAEVEAPARELVDQRRRLRVVGGVAHVEVRDRRAERDALRRERERLAEPDPVAEARAVDAREAARLDLARELERGAAAAAGTAASATAGSHRRPMRTGPEARLAFTPRPRRAAPGRTGCSAAPCGRARACGAGRRARAPCRCRRRRPRP